MYDRKSRMCLKRIKGLQKTQAACQWGYTAGLIMIALGFITSIVLFTQNTGANLTMILLASGLIVICISSIITELARLSEVWVRKKLRKHVRRQDDLTEPLNTFTIDKHITATFKQTNIAGRQPHLQKKTASG